MTPEELQRRVSSVKWFHTIDLGQGVVTPGLDNSPRKLEFIKLPPSLSGKTVLDIGAWDGFFSFEAERRGAKRVLATDWHSWGGPGWGTQAGFKLAREARNSAVEDQRVDVMDLSPESVGVFDVVFFLGVLYHLRHPLLALEKVASVTKELLILETQVDLLLLKTPAMTFLAGDKSNKDTTNWWAPNPPALLAMLRDVGFKRVDIVGRPRSATARAASALQSGKFARRVFQRSRFAVHAWK
ncbi:MAG TPA: DUF1698 domain-containing protein [Opitutales bacterium]|jgi:tRNA (mo5U34)-methyltransferase|nr:DUF1698 domain-containing protein [Opitutales bacterium]